MLGIIELPRIYYPSRLTTKIIFKCCNKPKSGKLYTHVRRIKKKAYHRGETNNRVSCATKRHNKIPETMARIRKLYKNCICKFEMVVLHTV